MKNKIFDFLWRKKRYALWIVDMAIIACSYQFLIYLLQGLWEVRLSMGNLARTCLVTGVAYTLLFYFGNLYNIVLKYLGNFEYIKLFLVGICSMVLIFVIDAIPVIDINMLPFNIILLANIFIIGGMVIVRFFIKYFITRSKIFDDKDSVRVLIVGAGNAGRLMADEMRTSEKNKFNIVGFIDDNPEKKGVFVNGIKVVGDRKEIIEVCSELGVQMIAICIPAASAKELQKIIAVCSETGCKIKVLPSFEEMLVSGKDFSTIKGTMRDVEITDLLERDSVVLDNEEIERKITGKTVMVTGGGGSIGSELCRQIARFNPEKLIILDIYENNAYDLQNELTRKFPKLNLDVVICSVRDLAKLEVIFDEYKPEMVYHAAAHKHVPLMEFSPDEAIKNNVFGTYNAAFCADKYGVDTFTLISTDKAVNPTNVMGATKRMCEMIVQAFQTVSKTKYTAVRFGNVLGSNGSLIPLFKKQIAEGGPVTITHKYITRFFMTIPEAAQLVLQSSVFAGGGEIFVLDMGKPVKIYNLAEKLIKLSGFTPGVDIDIEVVGLRPGEKLYEELLMDEEGLKNTKNSKIFIGKPIFSDMEVLKKDLEMLETVLDCGDKMRIKTTIAEIVDTYHPDLKNV